MTDSNRDHLVVEAIGSWTSEATPARSFLGLGIMGSRMARNLARAGYEVAVWKRTREKAERCAAERGVRPARRRPRRGERGRRDHHGRRRPEVEAVLFGDDGAAQALAPGALCVDMSTIAPTAVLTIGERLREHGISFVDAPVTGSQPRAEAGNLTIMAGGGFRAREATVRGDGRADRARGTPGHGAMAKLLNNALAAINAALAEALAWATAPAWTPRHARGGRSGSGASTMLELKAGPWSSATTSRSCKLAHMLKDVRHCLAEAQALGEDCASPRRPSASTRPRPRAARRTSPRWPMVVG